MVWSLTSINTHTYELKCCHAKEIHFHFFSSRCKKKKTTREREVVQVFGCQKMSRGKRSAKKKKEALRAASSKWSNDRRRDRETRKKLATVIEKDRERIKNCDAERMRENVGAANNFACFFFHRRRVFICLHEACKYLCVFVNTIA